MAQSMETPANEANRGPARNRRRRGSAMVEFALVFTIFLVMVFGFLELGRAIWIYTTVAHAARQAARYASLHGEHEPATDADLREVVNDHTVGLDVESITLETTWTPDRSHGSLVTVRVACDLPLIASPVVLDDSSLRLSSSGTAVVAQ